VTFFQKKNHFDETIFDGLYLDELEWAGNRDKRERDCKCRWLDIVPFLCIQDSRVGEWWLRALSESLQKHELPFWSERISLLASMAGKQSNKASIQVRQAHNYCHGLALFLSSKLLPTGKRGSTSPTLFNSNFCLYISGVYTNVGII